MRIVRGIYRYPIKGLSAEPLRGIELEAGKPFPFDRVFALVRPGVPVDAEAPRWAKKGLFLMLMLDEDLARVQTRVDVESLQLSVLREPAAARRGPSGSQPSAPHSSGLQCVLRADLRRPEGRQAVEAFFQQLLPKLQGTPKLVFSPSGHFMDKPDNVLSCINLATLRSLEAEWGCAVHPLRFRANFYVDGARPWEELDWVGSDIMLGDVSFRVDRRNGRCGATNVNPVSGERDMDIPGSLRKRFGHKDLGVYLIARNNGRVVVGDSVQVPNIAPVAAAASKCMPVPAPGHGNFICRGCYYIYEGQKPFPGAAALPFSALSEDWRCPDCGTSKASFRPHLPELTPTAEAFAAERA